MNDIGKEINIMMEVYLDYYLKLKIKIACLISIIKIIQKKVRI